jgi:hypothetical protein
MYESRTAAQIYALVVGLVFLAIGVTGFVTEAVIVTTGSGSFDEDRHVAIFTLDPWHSGLYVFAALLGLAAWRRADSARTFAFVVGAIFLVVGCWGLVEFGFDLGHHIFGLMDVGLADDIAHTVIGVASIAIGFASPQHGEYPPPQTAEFA